MRLQIHELAQSLAHTIQSTGQPIQIVQFSTALPFIA